MGPHVGAVFIAKKNHDEMSEHLHDLRRELIERLQEENATDLIGPMADCGKSTLLTCTCCGTTKPAEIHCKRRWCPACQPIVTAKRVSRWNHAIQKLQWPLFVTLTMENSTNPESLRKIKDGWGKLRRRKLINTKVKGGIATFEITNKGKGWHPHIHAVCDCRWLSLNVPEPLRRDSKDIVKEKTRLAQQELSSLWAEVINQPLAVVHVRRVYDPDSVALEILKYCLKGSELVSAQDEISPMLRVLAKTRMLAGWGSLHPLPSPDEEERPALKCDKCHAEKSFLPADIVHSISRVRDPRAYQPAHS